MRETASRGEERGADPIWTGSVFKSTGSGSDPQENPGPSKKKSGFGSGSPDLTL